MVLRVSRIGGCFGDYLTTDLVNGFLPTAYTGLSGSTRIQQSAERTRSDIQMQRKMT